MFNRKGQSILEYVIVLTAIVAAIIVGASAFASRDKTKGVGKIMDTAGTKIEGATGKIADAAK